MRERHCLCKRPWHLCKLRVLMGRGHGSKAMIGNRNPTIHSFMHTFIKQQRWTRHLAQSRHSGHFPTGLTHLCEFLTLSRSQLGSYHSNLCSIHLLCGYQIYHPNHASFNALQAMSGLGAFIEGTLKTRSVSLQVYNCWPHCALYLEHPPREEENII